jgi:ankyrin repeat protein
MFSWIAANFLLKNDPAVLAKLLEEGFIDFNVRMKGVGKTLFQDICQEAAKGDHEVYNLIDLGIRKGVDVNVPFPSGLGLIDIASMSAAPETARMLLKAGAKVRTPGCLVRLLKFNDLEIAQLAVKNTEAVERGRILRFAAENLGPTSNGEIFKWLVEQGGDVNEADADGLSPFSLVVKSGNLPLVEYCLAKGAQINPKGEGLYLPMEMACLLENDPEGRILKKLVERGGNLNVGGKLAFATPFAILVRKKQSALIGWAIKNGAEVNPSNPKKKITPIQAASLLSKEEDPGRKTFKLLVDAGASINTPGNSLAQAPFVELIAQGDLEAVKWCLERGAKVNPNDPQGDTPLQAAAKLPVGAELMFPLLVEAGADINDPGRTGIPPFVLILAKGNAELLKYFFLQGGKLEESLLENAFDSAVSSGVVEIIDILREQGLSISPQAVNNLKLIPIGYQTGGLEMLQRVLDMGGSFDELTESEKFVLMEIADERGEGSQIRTLMRTNLAPFRNRKLRKGHDT